jgi:hypothetical protein
MARYLKCGDKLFALNPKCGSSSFARAIIARWHPEIEQLITTAAYPGGQSADTGQWQLMVPYRTRPEAEVICMVREPVDRFRSAMSQVNITDVDATLDELINETGMHPEYRPVRGRRLLSEDVHFRPQSAYSGNPIRYFRFPDQIDAAAAALDLQLPLPEINEGTGAKPTLTQEQEHRVRELYADDVSLWASVS